MFFTYTIEPYVYGMTANAVECNPISRVIIELLNRPSKIKFSNCVERRCEQKAGFIDIFFFFVFVNIT